MIRHDSLLKIVLLSAALFFFRTEPLFSVDMKQISNMYATSDFSNRWIMAGLMGAMIPRDSLTEKYSYIASPLVMAEYDCYPYILTAVMSELGAGVEPLTIPLRISAHLGVIGGTYNELNFENGNRRYKSKEYYNAAFEASYEYKFWKIGVRTEYHPYKVYQEDGKTGVDAIKYSLSCMRQIPLTARTTVIAEAEIEYINDAYSNALYSVYDSAGNPVFTGRSSIENIAAYLICKYSLTGNSSIIAVFSPSMLLGSAADSPVKNSKHEITSIVMFNYILAW
jgi:hypothetical protein